MQILPCDLWFDWQIYGNNARVIGILARNFFYNFEICYSSKKIFRGFFGTLFWWHCGQIAGGLK